VQVECIIFLLKRVGHIATLRVLTTCVGCQAVASKQGIRISDYSVFVHGRVLRAIRAFRKSHPHFDSVEGVIAVESFIVLEELLHFLDVFLFIIDDYVHDSGCAVVNKQVQCELVRQRIALDPNSRRCRGVVQHFCNGAQRVA
jgi:hypothetical protein